MSEAAGQQLTGLAPLAQAICSLRGASGGAAGAEAVKSCCASVYGSDLVALFLGDSYHPGGAALTRRLADLLDLRPSEQVLDVASGTGTTAFLLVQERGVDAVGVELGESQVARARAEAERLGLTGRVRFEMGDAERLSLPGTSFDAALCECAFCTFPSKDVAAAELARVLRPGGRVGIADIWLEPERLDQEMRGLAGWVACLAGARPIAELVRILETAGLGVTNVERHDDALAETIEQVEARIRALKIADLPALRGLDYSRGIAIACQAAQVVEEGRGGYVLLAGQRR